MALSDTEPCNYKGVPTTCLIIRPAWRGEVGPQTFLSCQRCKLKRLHISAHAALHAYACAAHSTNLLEVYSYSLGLLTKPYRLKQSPEIVEVSASWLANLLPWNILRTLNTPAGCLEDFGRWILEGEGDSEHTHFIGELQRRVWSVTASKWQWVRNSMQFCAIVLSKSRTTTAWVPRSII